MMLNSELMVTAQAEAQSCHHQSSEIISSVCSVSPNSPWSWVTISKGDGDGVTKQRASSGPFTTPWCVSLGLHVVLVSAS